MLFILLEFIVAELEEDTLAGFTVVEDGAVGFAADVDVVVGFVTVVVRVTVLCLLALLLAEFCVFEDDEADDTLVEELEFLFTEVVVGPV